MLKCPHYVVLLGAGCSYCATRGKAPLTSGFIDHVASDRYPTLARFLEFLPRDHRRDLAYVLNELDSLDEIPLPQLKASVIPRIQDSGMIRTELQRYCVDRLGNIHADAVNLPVLGSIHNMAASGATIITTNYDSIAERWVSRIEGVRHGHMGDCPHCKMCTILDTDCPCDSNGRVPEQYWRGALLKLHGSVAWRMCRGPCCASGCIVPDRGCRPYQGETCERCTGATDPVVVLPRLRGKYDQFPRLNAMWDAAHQALSDAKTLGVFGFSFSDADRELCLLIRTSLSSGRLRCVSIIDAEPEPVAARLLRLLPDGLRPTIRTLRIAPDFTMPFHEAWRDLAVPT